MNERSNLLDREEEQMVKSKGVTVPELWTERREKDRLSLKQFDDLIQSQLTHLAETQISLHFSYAVFKIKDDDILPVQCKKAINSLDDLNKNVQEFCDLFSETMNLPVVYTALRYRLLAVLYFVEEQACELIDLIDSYREVCMTSSPYAKQQRREINDAFERLLQHVDDISQRSKDLSNEALFQEQQLTLGFEGRLPLNFKNRNNSSLDEHPLYIVK